MRVAFSWLLISLYLVSFYSCLPTQKANDKLNNKNETAVGLQAENTTAASKGNESRDKINQTLSDDKNASETEEQKTSFAGKDGKKGTSANKTAQETKTAQEGKSKEAHTKTSEEVLKGSTKEETKKSIIRKLGVNKEQRKKKGEKKDQIYSQVDLFNQMYQPFNLIGAENTPAALLSISGLQIENGKILSSNVKVFKGE